MGKYVIRRILLMIPVVIGVVIIVFCLNRLMPGDPVEMQLPDGYTQEEYDLQAEKMGLDRPFVVQLGDYFWGIVSRFDLGTSYITGRTVASDVQGRIWITVKIGLLSILITMLIALPFGILSATHHNTVTDYIVTVLSIFFSAMPGFWMALMMILIFSLKLKWLPASQLTGWKNYIMPVLCNALMPISMTTRMTRSSMLEVVRQDYIRTARSKGLSQRIVTYRHALRNALIPIITMIGSQFSVILGGSVVIESVFSIPGMGALLVSSITTRDYMVISGVTFLISLFVSIINLFVDIAYSFVDPRIKAQFIRSSKARVKESPKVSGKEAAA